MASNTNEISPDDTNAPAQKNKDWAAADLEKVTDFNDDNDNGKEVSSDKLDSLISTTETKKTPKVINIRKEDVQLLMDELELPRIRAEKKLVEHNGDVKAAAKELLGF